MKKIAFVTLLFLTLLLGWSCSSDSSNPYSPGPANTPTFSPTTCTDGSGNTCTPTATPAIGAVLKVITGPHYALSSASVSLSAPITITQGQSVVWDSTNSGHPLNIDNGSASCVVSGNTSFPVTETFNSLGTFQFHCGLHSSCGNGNCTGCSGNMVGTIQVN